MGVTTSAQWQWASGASGYYTPNQYPSGTGALAETKTGLTPTDLQNFVGVPLNLYNTQPPTPVASGVVQQWIRWAEDWVESQTGILLCQSWVASPPAVNQLEAQALGITTASSGGYQIQGLDYDIEDAAYDFFYPRARDEGWMIYSLRYKPVKQTIYGPLNENAIKNISYIYPLLNEFFRVPPSWHVEDHDFGLVRLVPSTNVQMLPLFAMQLAFMGFAESVPGAIWMQYLAGLTPADYKGRFSFIPQLVLVTAAIQALSAIQTTISMGAIGFTMTVDGLEYATKYSPGGPFGYQIDNYRKQQDDLMQAAINKVAGPVLSTL